MIHLEERMSSATQLLRRRTAVIFIDERAAPNQSVEALNARPAIMMSLGDSH